MAMGADYSSELIFNETCAPQFNGHNNSFLASVYDQVPTIFSFSVRSRKELWIQLLFFDDLSSGKYIYFEYTDI